MAAGAISFGLLAGLALALAVAAVTDLRWRHIDNRLNAALALAAPLFWWASDLQLWPGMALQLALAVGVLAVLACLFALGAMGGGDVKLVTALALWLPWRPFLLLVVVMALLGGLLTLLFIARHRLLRRTATLQVPYGVAIAGAGWWVIASVYAPGALVR